MRVNCRIIILSGGNFVLVYLNFGENLKENVGIKSEIELLEQIN